MIRSVKNIACLLPVAVVHSQLQVAVPFVAALFLWPVYSTANHLAQNVVLLYGFQLRVLKPCIMSFWAITFQKNKVQNQLAKADVDKSQQAARKAVPGRSSLQRIQSIFKA